MQDWNIVATSAEGKHHQAIHFLMKYGEVALTPFYNVIMVRAHDPAETMAALASQWITSGGRLLYLNRVIPVTETFSFSDRGTFERQAAQIARAWGSRLKGKSFHVRMHRRGFKDQLRSVDEEQYLDAIILEATQSEGEAGSVSFVDPDGIVAVETIGTQAGMSLWFREELGKYPFLGLD